MEYVEVCLRPARSNTRDHDSLQGTAALRYFREFREYMNPLLKESKFRETGVLTANDRPAFETEGMSISTLHLLGSSASRNNIASFHQDYLPADKQYLITRNVPCLKRVAAMEYSEKDDDDQQEIDDDGGWVATHRNHVVATAALAPEVDVAEVGGVGPSGTVATDARDIDDEIADATNAADFITGQVDALSLAKPTNSNDVPENLDDIPDIDEEELELVDSVDEEDPAAMNTSDGGKFVKTRTYDMSITYDKYYQTPRVFLFGYDENRKPLTPQQIFEDISQDHAKKTVTIETHPHEAISLASIHPCKHGNVMKKLLDHMVASGKEELRVDQYLLLFLKFMSSVLPTMEYDYTGDGF
ncbi:Arabinose-proton symporter (Arabinose transporter) [Entophlyctis luteolus]|nr:Arabinose-proton symporter (Arabinose transporter) [Entophlyctis luteolus]